MRAPCAIASEGGDCDQLAVIVAALDLRSGLPARITWLRQGGPEDHVCAEVRLGPRWRWQETTMLASLGESPSEAMRRVGMRGRTLWRGF